jgi:hypothetical protein
MPELLNKVLKSKKKNGKNKLTTSKSITGGQFLIGKRF